MPFNNFVLVSNEIKSFPQMVTLTGTVSSSGTTVTGTGTDFYDLYAVEDAENNGNEVLKYKYLIDPAVGEIREIAKILNATKLLIKTAFTNPLSGTLTVIDNYGIKEAIVTPVSAGVVMYEPETAGMTIITTVPISMKSYININPFALNCSGGLRAEVTQAATSS